jgi:tRNA/tmRNA/rRNA uracil-C5-methylase (TrmA/RlmC/RlmD family)
MRLTIEKIVHGGFGLARHDSGVVFVSDALPGEVIEAELVAPRGGCQHARVIEILHPSPLRRSPPCIHAGECGGCDWQHIQPDAQSQFKQDIFLDCLRRLGRMELSCEIECISGPELGYRHRAQFKQEPTSGAVGFFARGTNQVVAIKHCPLLVDELNRLLQTLQSPPSTLPSHCSSLSVLAGSDGSIASSPPLASLTQPTTTIRVGDHCFDVEGSSFFQQNRFLLKDLGLWAEGELGGELAIDLFGGLGFFGVLLAKRFQKLLLVERESSLVAMARKNFAANGIDHAQALAATAELFFARTPGKRPDALIVDPPRSGLTRQVREGIARLAPQTIVSIACDPATQARDVGFFVNQCGYRICRAAVFDLYPNTHHLESALLLRR